MSEQLARGIWAKFGPSQNPWSSPNGMEDNLRLLDDHLALYTVRPPVAPGTPLPLLPEPGQGQIYLDGTYSVFNANEWRNYPSRKGMRVMLVGGARGWFNVGGAWAPAEFDIGAYELVVDRAFGGSLTAAFDFLAARGPNEPSWLLQLGLGPYNIVGYFKAPSDVGGNPALWIANRVDNVVMKGRGRGKIVGDPRESGCHVANGSGTVVQGTLFNMANNFATRGFSVDCGPKVCAEKNGGIALEGFMPGSHPYSGDGNDDETYIRGGSAVGISVLAVSPSEQDLPKPSNTKHAFLWEHVSGYFGNDIEIAGGFHGMVFKGKQGRFGTVWSWGGWNNTAIFKAEERTLCEDVTIGQLILGKPGTSYLPPGGGARVPYRSAGAQFQSVKPLKLDGSDEFSGPWICRGISIGQLVLENLVYGAMPVNHDEQIRDIVVASISGKDILYDGFTIGRQYRSCLLGQHVFTNVGTGITSDEGCVATIGDGQVTLPTVYGYRLAGAVVHGNLHVHGSPGVGVYGYGAVIDPSKITGANNAGGNYSGVRSTTIAFESSWAFRDASTRVELWGRRVIFQGVLGAEAGATRFIGTIEPAFRPERPIDIPAMQEYGSVLAPAWVRITTDGRITLWGGIPDGQPGAPWAFVHVMQGEWMFFP